MVRVILTVLLLLAIQGCSSSNAGLEKFVGRQVGSIRLTLLDGRMTPLSEYKGRTVVLAFWASWCNYSRPVIAELAELARQYKGRNDIVFMPVSMDKHSDYQKLLDEIERRSLKDLEHVFSGNEEYDEVYQAFGISEIPYLIVVSPRGDVLGGGKKLSQIKPLLN